MDRRSALALVEASAPTEGRRQEGRGRVPDAWPRGMRADVAAAYVGRLATRHKA